MIFCRGVLRHIGLPIRVLKSRHIPPETFIGILYLSSELIKNRHTTVDTLPGAPWYSLLESRHVYSTTAIFSLSTQRQLLIENWRPPTTNTSQSLFLNLSSPVNKLDFLSQQIPTRT
jgi:hypothetical protein